MTIRIFTAATNYYQEYFINNFLPTVNNVFPNYIKEVIVYSDGLKKYDHKIIGNTFVKVKHIYDLYSFDITFNKFNFINFELDNCEDDDLIMWIDVDTMFGHNEIGELFILNNYMTDKVFVSEHPNYYVEYVYNPYYIEDRVSINSDKERKGLFTIYNINKPELITSFLYFNKQSFKQFFNIFNSYIQKMTLNTPRVMPIFNDESIVNYMYYNDNIIEGKLYVTINNFAENNTFDKNIAYIPSLNKLIHISGDSYIQLNEVGDYIICNQKFKTSIKDNNKYHYK